MTDQQPLVAPVGNAWLRFVPSCTFTDTSGPGCAPAVGAQTYAIEVSALSNPTLSLDINATGSLGGVLLALVSRLCLRT
jgi:hypothetical protein